MKTTFRKMPMMLLVAAVLLMGTGLVSSCKSSETSMYERHQSNKGAKVNKNIKVKGSNKTNSHTTRSY